MYDFFFGATLKDAIIVKLNRIVLQFYRRDGVVVKASASQLVDLGFIPLVESYQMTLKNGIHSFPAWHSAFRASCGEQSGKLACCVLGQGTLRYASAFMLKTGGPDISQMLTSKQVRTFRPKYSDTVRFLVNGG